MVSTAVGTAAILGLVLDCPFYDKKDCVSEPPPEHYHYELHIPERPVEMYAVTVTSGIEFNDPAISESSDDPVI